MAMSVADPGTSAYRAGCAQVRIPNRTGSRDARDVAGLTRALDAIQARLAAARRQKRSVPEDLTTDARRILEQLIDHEPTEARLFQRSVF